MLLLSYVLVVSQAPRFLQRLECQFDNTMASFRKAPTFKEACKIHLTTGLYLAFLDKFSKWAPQRQWTEIKVNLDTQFDAGYLDGDFAHVAEECVPPIDLRSVSAFRLV